MASCFLFAHLALSFLLMVLFKQDTFLLCANIMKLNEGNVVQETTGNQISRGRLYMRAYFTILLLQAVCVQLVTKVKVGVYKDELEPNSSSQEREEELTVWLCLIGLSPF